MHITQVMNGVHLCARTCARADEPLFRISETDGRIALKFGMWLVTHQPGFLQRLGMDHSYVCAPANPFFVCRKHLDVLR